MSHFSVAVFSRHPGDVEELLAPYNEQTEDEAYLEFEEACESMEDIRARYAQEKQGGESFEAFLRRWYATRMTGFTCWAFVAPNGEWYENGQMGWFAANDATKESRDRFALELEDMLKSDPNLWLTIVDCHI